MLESHALSSRRYTHLKGEVGERVMDALVGKDWKNIEPNIGTQDRRGIDGLYMRFKKGKPSSLMVAEAKYNTSPLGITSDGLQMSREWISSRLEAISKRYSHMAADIAAGEYVASPSPPPTYEPTVGEVEMPDGRKVTVWRDRQSGKWMVYPPENVDNTLLARQMNRVAIYLQGAADGKIDYRTRIDRVRFTGNKLLVDVLDPETSTVRTIDVDNLPAADQRRIKNAIIDTIAEDLHKNDPSVRTPSQAQQKARVLYEQAEKTCGLEDFLNRYHPVAKWSPLLGVKTAALGGIFGGVLAGGLDSIFQLIQNGQVNLRRAGTFTALGALSEFSGVWAGSQFAYGLESLAAQRVGVGVSSLGLRPVSGFIGGAAGGAVTATLFSFGSYWLGYSDLTTAQRNTVAGVAGSVVGAAASTAISSLSGAAAANAGLMGGGALAAGGLGGTIIISGGVAIIVIATAAGVMYIYHISDKTTEMKKVGAVVNAIYRSAK